MRKWKWGAAIGCVLGLAAIAGTQLPRWEAWQDHDGDQEEEGEGPPDGDYWATRASYPTGNFDQRWLKAAAEKERQMRVRVPAGKRTYSKAMAPQSPLALDPNHFVPLGPMPLNNTQMSYGAVSGRINVIKVDPTQTVPGSTVVYAGSDGGGIWKTTNCCTASTTWQVTTDVPEVASMSISDIALDPHNPNIVYGATGDLNFGSFSFGSAGVLKSTDAGQTWALLGATEFAPLYPGSVPGFPQYQAVGKVVVDPNNSNNVVVGTKTSLYFSYNGGTNWTGPCYTNPYAVDNIPAGTTAQRQDVTGLLAVDQGGGVTKLYTAIGTRGAPTPVQPDLGKTGSNGVYSTMMPVSGCPAVANWTLLNNNWPVGTGNGVASATTLGRIEIAVAPSDSQRLYVEVEDATTRAIRSIFRSDNGGATWTLKSSGGVNTDSTNVGCESAVSLNGGAQMWYDAGLTVDPTNANRIWMSTTDATLSSDGAANFYDVTCGWNTTRNLNGGVRLHVDHHARAYVGNDPKRLLLGSDGGVYYSDNADVAVTSSSPSVNHTMKFISLNTNINSIEFYFGDITGHFATSANPAIGGGEQDNGCSRAAFSGTPTGPVQWNSTCGGDGTTTRIEPVLGNVWFNSSQNGALGRNTAGGTGSYSTATPTATGGGSWSSETGAIFMVSYDIYKWGDTSTPGSGCTATGCNHMIAGGNRLWENLDILNATTSTMRAAWKARTLNLTKNNLILGTDNRSYINYVAYSYSDPTIAMVGTNDGNVQVVYGLGTTASANCATPGTDPNCADAVNVTDSNSVLPNRPIQGVRFDPTTANIAYAAVGGFDENTPGHAGHLFQLNCSGVHCASFSWVDKTGNLPNIPAQQVMPNPNLSNQVFVGTDWGLYYTDDINVATPVWNRFENFPHVMVWELVVDRGFTTLAAFTRSRGAWVWPLPLVQTDLTLSVTGPSTGSPGGNLLYTYTVNNVGATAALNTVMADPTPAGTTFVSNSGDCVTAFPCALGTLAPGDSRSITSTFQVQPAFAGSITNTGTVSSDGSELTPANNTTSVVTTVAGSADLGIGVTGPASTTAGNTVSYTITVTNNGPTAAVNSSVSDTTPSGLSFVSNTGACVTAFPCTFASIENGGTRTITATYQVPANYTSPNPIVDTAAITSATPDPVPGNNSANASTNVTATADLAISVGAPVNANAGGTVAFTITVTNNGPNAAVNAQVADVTPSGLSFVSNAGDCSTAFPCSFASIEAGGTRTITATYQVPPAYTAPNPIADTASVSSDTSDPVPGNNSASANAPLVVNADIAVSVSNAPTQVVPGKILTYSLTVTNNGPATANAVQLTTSSANSAPVTAVGGSCTGAFPCALGTLAPGDTRTVNVKMCVPRSGNGVTFTLNATASSSTADATAANNTSSLNIPVPDVLFYDGFESCP
jgi:uncharacterized repeat protein (TIGR01451 family)